MKRSSRAVWVVLAVILVGLFLLVDPLGWFSEKIESRSLVDPTPRVEAEEEVAEPLVKPPVDEIIAAEDPGSERQAIDPAIEAATTTLRVLDRTDRVVVDAQLILVRGEELLANERTDEAGELKLDADGLPAGLIIAVPDRPPEWHDVVLHPGRQDVFLVEASRLAGRFVTEDGSSPGVLRLSLDSDHSPTTNSNLPPIVTEIVRYDALRGGYSIFETDEEGAFDLSGLPASWSGRIWMRRGWKVLSTSNGKIEPAAGGVRFTEPVTDVLVRLARRRTVVGRLVLRGDGTPLENTRIAARLRSPNAKSPENFSSKTDEEGRFSLECKQDVISELELRLGLRFADGVPLLRLDGKSLPADGDLGDVMVDDVRHVPFLLQDVVGEPIRNGAAIAGGVRSERTGTDGRGELRWVPGVVHELVGEARGFTPTVHAIPPVVTEPLVVTLARANRLEVKLLLPEESSPDQFKVVLRGEGAITAGPVPDLLDQMRHVDRWTRPLAKLSREPADEYLCAALNSRNTAIFYALRPNVNIELEVQGMTGYAVYHSETLAPLGPEEHREIEVPLQVSLIVFRGRVLDENGNPLVRAHLQLGGQLRAFTEDDGGFECFLEGPETGTLLVAHRTCTTKYLHNYAVPIDGRPVEFRLSPARPLTVEVVDENGTPMPQAEIYTEYGGFTTGTYHLEGHRHLVPGMPEEPFVIRAELAGRYYRQEHDPSRDEARVVVPVHGRVVGLVNSASTAGRAGRFHLILNPQDTEDARAIGESRDSVPDLRIELPVVHPGTYEATLLYKPTKDEQAAGREQLSSAPVTITVEAGRETEVRLVLPAGGGG